MGCGDSKLDNPSSEQQPNSIGQQNQEGLPGNRVKGSPKFGSIQPEDDSVFIQQNLMNKKKPFKVNHMQSNSFFDNQGKQNLMKVKKAKELQTMPQQQKFMNDIVKKSRAKLAAIDPTYKESYSQSFKPIVEYSPQKKGDILDGVNSKGKSQWNKPIAEVTHKDEGKTKLDDSYFQLNEKVKSPYKIKQIEKRLNDIRNGRLEGENGQHNYFQSNKTVYLN